MTSFQRAVVCLLVLGGGGVTAFAQPGRTAADTITHELLKVEQEAYGRTDAENAQRLKLLDLLIEQAVVRITALQADESTPEGIQSMFATVDQVLVDNHYNVYVETATLSDALQPGIPQCGGISSMTEAMKKHREENPKAVYYRFDCDTGSFIHLAVFDRLKKPVVLVEVPRHNFVRWRIAPDRHVNWDVNHSRSYTDDEYRTSRLIQKETEERNHYLRDMSREEIKAYHAVLAADVLRDRREFEKALSLYEVGVKIRPYSSMALNNVAWTIATQPDLQKQELLDRALTSAKSAVALRPKDGNLLDTLAAVYAARHEFEKAIETEQRGRNSEARIKAYTERKTPADLYWRLE